MPETMRLQKYMGQAWICSRRKAEEYIEAGQVFINGEKAKIGQSVDPKGDVVTLWKWAEMSQQKFVYYKYNKPRGVESTCAQKEGQSIVDMIDVKERVFPVGRLDKDSTGLIILTNDGRMTNYLTHPRYWHEKEYVVETFWPINDDQLERMSQGVLILGKRTKKCRVERIAAGKFSIVLTEWKNRQIRRMVEEVESKVKKLKRVRIVSIVLDGLKDGQLKGLTRWERDTLFQDIGLDTE
jgi:23S rRNA pseudouridine2605 synthase